MVSDGGTDAAAGADRPDRAGRSAAPRRGRGGGGGPPADASGTVVAGERILLLDRWSTVVFAVVAVAAAALPDPLELVAVPVFLALFLLGCGTFLWAYAVAIGRSRYDEVNVGGVFFLAGGVAPAPAARTLRLLLAVQIVVAVAVAAVRPFTALAFAVLVPMAGLGLMALWGAYHGGFPPRVAPAAPARSADAGTVDEHDAGPGGVADEAPPPAQ